MNPDSNTRSLLAHLGHVSADFSGAAAREKLQLLAILDEREMHAPHLIKQLHDLLCYLRAFPDNAAVYGAANTGLRKIPERVAKLKRTQRDGLADSGIAGTSLYYEYSYESAAWLSQRYPTEIEIDWPNYETPERLDNLLSNLVTTAEQQTFDEAQVGTQEWIHNAKGDMPVSDLRWLLGQCGGGNLPNPFWAQLYDGAEVPVVWKSASGVGSRTNNCFTPDRIAYRNKGMRSVAGDPAEAVSRPLRGIEHLSVRRANRLLDVVRAGLLARHREVYAMQHANPREVFLGSLGRGVQILILGVLPERRLSLETNYGYVIFSNGMPVGYGGVTPLFHQNNTGINIFAEYRKGESAFMYLQVLRMAHTLFGSTRFVVNPYQFGAGNREALGSGAFWFYYRLGFRPVEAGIRRIARTEFKKIRARRAYRTPMETLKDLASCDLHLQLPGAHRNQFFDERWLGVIAAGVTRALAQRAQWRRRQSIKHLVQEVASKLRITNRHTWPPDERTAFNRLAPVVALIDDIDTWSASERRSLIALMRAKGAPAERDFAVRLRKHDRLRLELTGYCKAALRENRR